MSSLSNKWYTENVSHNSDKVEVWRFRVAMKDVKAEIVHQLG